MSLTAMPLIDTPFSTTDLSVERAGKATVPILVATALYLPIVFGLKKFYSNREPYSGRKLLVAWNLTLSILSGLGSFILIFCNPIANLANRNCTYDVHTTWGNAVISLFCLTKFIEYGDTFLLCIKKRPTIFLHLYHHVTVTLYCLHALQTKAPYGHMFVFVNLNVHAVMYMYYALAIMERTKRHPFMRAVRPYITSSQLVQMFVGTGIAYVEILSPVSDSPAVHRDKYLALAMYISYAYLFGDFWIKNYTNNAPTRTLLGCSPIALLCLALPALFMFENTNEASTRDLAILASITSGIIIGLAQLGDHTRLSFTSICSPMAATAIDCQRQEPEESQTSSSIALFDKGHSACIDCIRYATLPVCLATFGWKHSPLLVAEIDLARSYTIVCSAWILDGWLNGCFSPSHLLSRPRKAGHETSDTSNDLVKDEAITKAVEGNVEESEVVN